MCDFGGDMGGAGDGVYNNGFNTMGVGDPVAPQDGFGSGDIYNIIGIPATKRSYPSTSKKKEKKLPFRETQGFSMDPRPMIVPIAGRTAGTRKKTTAPKPKK